MMKSIIFAHVSQLFESKSMSLSTSYTEIRPKTDYFLPTTTALLLSLLLQLSLYTVDCRGRSQRSFKVPGNDFC